MARRLLVIASALMLLGGSIPAPVSATSDVDPAQLQGEIRFRTDFGFRADEEYVRQIISTRPRDARWPATLTDEESAEMDRRRAMETAMEPLEKAAQQMPAFAGHWIDQPGGGVIVVAFNAAAADRVPELEPLVPSGAELRVVEVPFTLTELRTLKAQIGDDRAALEAQGIDLAYWGVDVSENRVRVGVVGLDDDIATTLHERYGDRLLLEGANPQVSGCSSRENCIGPPLRGGISGSPEGTPYGGRCSIAFLIHYSTYVQWLTAGHCAQTTDSGNCTGYPVWCWYNGGASSRKIGEIKATCWPQCQYSDAARAGNISSTYASSKLYLTTTTTFNVTGSQGYNQDTPDTEDGYNDNDGDIVCINARRAGYNCGRLEWIGTMDYGAVYFDEMRFATYDSYYGDSGGAVHSYPSGYYVTALGVQSGCTQFDNPQDPNVCIGYGVYSHIFRVLGELGGAVCSTYNPCP